MSSPLHNYQLMCRQSWASLHLINVKTWTTVLQTLRLDWGELWWRLYSWQSIPKFLRDTCCFNWRIDGRISYYLNLLLCRRNTVTDTSSNRIQIDTLLKNHDLLDPRSLEHLKKHTHKKQKNSWQWSSSSVCWLRLLLTADTPGRGWSSHTVKRSPKIKNYLKIRNSLQEFSIPKSLRDGRCEIKYHLRHQ